MRSWARWLETQRKFSPWPLPPLMGEAVLVVDVRQPASANLLAGQAAGLVLREQVLVHVLDVGVVVGAPNLIRSAPHPVDVARQIRAAKAEEARLILLAPILARVEDELFTLADANLVHLGDNAGPVGEALPKPKPLQLLRVIRPRNRQLAGRSDRRPSQHRHRKGAEEPPHVSHPSTTRCSSIPHPLHSRQRSEQLCLSAPLGARAGCLASRGPCQPPAASRSVRRSRMRCAKRACSRSSSVTRREAYSRWRTAPL